MPFLVPGAMCIRPPSEPSMEEDVKVVGSLSGFAPGQSGTGWSFRRDFGMKIPVPPDEDRISQFIKTKLQISVPHKP